MIPAVQRWFTELGEAGCYAICLILTAGRMLGKELDIFTEFVKLVHLKLVYLNTSDFDDPKNCEVQDTPLVMKVLLDGGVNFTYRKDLGNYIPKKDEFCVEKWFRSFTSKGTEYKYTHFVLPDYDPLGNSKTKELGTCVEKRVFKVLV